MTTLNKENKTCMYRVSQINTTLLIYLEYLKDGSLKWIVLLVCYSVLPYNSIKANFSFLWRKYWVSKYKYDFQVFYLYNKMESYFFHIITSLSIFLIQKYFKATIVFYLIRFSQEWEKNGSKEVSKSYFLTRWSTLPHC